MGVDFRDEGELVRAALARGAAIRASGAPTLLQPLLMMEVRRRAQPARRATREPSLQERLTGAFHREPSAETDALARAVRDASAAHSKELFDAALRMCAGVRPAQDMLCARFTRVVRRVFADGAALEARCHEAAAAALAAEPLDLDLARGAFVWDGGARAPGGTPAAPGARRSCSRSRRTPPACARATRRCAGRSTEPTPASGC